MAPTSAPSGTADRRMRSGARARILAALAVVGTAALLTACATAGPGQSTAPTGPGTGVAGAAPVPIDDERLANPMVGDLVAADGYALRWNVAGESVAFFLGGSGGGGGCIPQPHAIELDQAAAELHLGFDGPDPAMACTADFRIHGWELALPESVDASQVWTVLLQDLQQPGTIETQLGPDDILTSGATADPQPSLIPDAPTDGAAPAPIPSDQLPEADVSMQDASVRWIEPGRRLAVLLGGSGAAQCVPTPISARATGPGTVEVAFEFPSGDMDCSADFQLYGWQFELEEPVSGTLPVEVTVTGATAADSSTVLPLQPDELLGTP
ncbi:hypothetical protein [Agrococcus beijingensis]|uniref:hypothetical protein n=1 Tax=Agrococcus beijingensis TaxID=3068634 RepID=UPI0027412167|nr:hypothetical protein [Agrococcus sp. REN33]